MKSMKKEVKKEVKKDMKMAKKEMPAKGKPMMSGAKKRAARSIAEANK